MPIEKDRVTKARSSGWLARSFRKSSSSSSPSCLPPQLCLGGGGDGGGDAGLVSKAPCRATVGAVPGRRRCKRARCGRGAAGLRAVGRAALLCALQVVTTAATRAHVRDDAMPTPSRRVAGKMQSRIESRTDHHAFTSHNYVNL
eukprot:4703564-Pleurochrysis_carterae.AAC.3